MVASGVIFGGVLAAAVTFASQAASLELFVVLVVGGFVAWRSKRGDFYKQVAEEKTAETERLRVDNARLKELTDITPVLKALEKVTTSLDHHAELLDQVFNKVRDMNGSLRAHGVAMQALADRLVLDEAARALLAEAAREKEPAATRHEKRRNP